MAKKKYQIRGAQILSDDLYLAYYEETKNAAQQRIWTFYEAINIIYSKSRIMDQDNKRVNRKQKTP